MRRMALPAEIGLCGNGRRAVRTACFLRNFHNIEPVGIGARLVAQRLVNEPALEQRIEVSRTHFDRPVRIDQRGARIAEAPVRRRTQQQRFDLEWIDGKRFRGVVARSLPVSGNRLHPRSPRIIDGLARHARDGIVIGANGALRIACNGEGIACLAVYFGAHCVLGAGQPFGKLEEGAAGIGGPVELHQCQRLAVKAACRVFAAPEFQRLRHVERARGIPLNEVKAGIIAGLPARSAPLRMCAAGCEEKKGESKDKLFHGGETCPAWAILQGKNGYPMAAGKRLFCFGCGYSARVFAARFKARGGAVAGTCRTPDKAARLAASGIVPFLFGGGAPLADASAALSGTTHLLISTPPDENGDPVLAAHAEDLLKIAPGIEWAGYLSTTGVYGDRQGGWVDETTPLDPAVTRSDRRVKAEAAWTEFANSSGLPLHIFRLAGIYGPGRNQLTSVIDGSARRIVKEGQIFSRIHVEDIANVLDASIARPNPGAIYNVCDDEPAPAPDVVAHAAELLGRAPPPEVPFEKADLSPMGRSFYMSSRRVSNRRIHEELGVALDYPTYREGLKSLLGTL